MQEPGADDLDDAAVHGDAGVEDAGQGGSRRRPWGEAGTGPHHVHDAVPATDGEPLADQPDHGDEEAEERNRHQRVRQQEQWPGNCRPDEDARRKADATGYERLGGHVRQPGLDLVDRHDRVPGKHTPRE